MSNENLTGQLVGQYELRELLGVGGMGVVYRAHQVNLERSVAFKVLSPQLAAETGYIERFYREARTAAALEHTHIVPIYDYGVQGNLSYVVMRLLTGGTLNDRLQQRANTNQALPSLGETGNLLKQLASALDYAHSQSVIHRDVKPSNVMFDNQGNSYLVDFGIAKLLEVTHSITATGAALGTPSYMPPEQWRSDELTPAVDQYALAVMIYALITGRVPFEATTPYGLMHKHLNEPPTPPQSYRADIPSDVTLVLERALAKQPTDRFPSVTAFAKAFTGAIGNQDGEATNFFITPLRSKPRPAGTTPSGGSRSAGSPTVDRPIYRHPLIWLAAAVIVLLAVALLVQTLGKSGDNGQVLTPPNEVALLDAPAVSDEPTDTETGPVVEVLVTDTTTPLPEPTVIHTISPTSTHAIVETIAPTQTPEPEITLVPTITVTHTPEPTDTVMPTIDPREVARTTRDALATRTATAWTRTPTPDLDATIAMELTALFHEDQTSTATLWTFTPTLTATATNTLTYTPTATATATLTATPTATATTTATLTPTATLIPTLTAIPTTTATLDPLQVALARAENFSGSNTEWEPFVHDFDGVEMVLVPAGCFMMGGTKYGDEQPVHRVCLQEPYWMDRTEVTNGQFAMFNGQAESASYWIESERPREQISWFEARDFCERRDARLPTEAEWEFAARGPDGWEFPWGNEAIPTNAIWNTGQTANVGSRPLGVSWVGALDLSGNVWEWIADLYSDEYYGTLAEETVNPTGPASGEKRVLRGGSWDVSDSGVDVLRGAYRATWYPDVRSYVDGFRCVRSASNY